jgi:hypothetical protein
MSDKALLPFLHALLQEPWNEHLPKVLADFLEDSGDSGRLAAILRQADGCAAWQISEGRWAAGFSFEGELPLDEIHQCPEYEDLVRRLAELARPTSRGA